VNDDPSILELFQMAAHDLRSPLGTVRLATDVIAAEPLSEPARDALVSARRALDRLEGLTAQLTGFARGSRVGDRVARLDWSRELERSLARWRRPPLRLERAIAPDLHVRGDAEWLDRAVDNLLDNAARHAAGRVRVALERVHDQAILRVSDDGPGVPSPLAARLTQPWVSGGGGGLGLGLTVVSHVARTHDGLLRIRESGEGGLPGACFELSLPVAQDDGSS